ncbi:MAG: signal peptidase II [Myxococcaceae bacterium]|nr:signal peptidase II [Myxococcaceae bacterium]MCA3012299.1 signal peptidase II [Myxococcaceae bacterium]
MSNKWVFLAVVSVVVVVADQWTKFVTLERLSYAYEGASSRLGVFVGAAPEQGLSGYHFQPRAPIVVSESFFRFRYAENPGAAFGLFRTVPDHLRGPLFHVVSIGAVLLILHSWRQLTGVKVERWARWGLPLVFGGALGNYLDRLARGFVIDFLEAHWFEQAYWPAFNVADSAIVVGVGLLLVDSFVRKETKAVKPAAA